MKRLLVISIVLATELLALNNPRLSKADNRIGYAAYNANDVFKIVARNGYVSMIEFNKDERIVNMVTGFSQGWEIIARENYLFAKAKAYVAEAQGQNFVDENGDSMSFDGGRMVIQPNKKDWATNLIVTTNKRVYAFDLTLADDNAKETEVHYKVEFSYPGDIEKQNIAERKKKQEEKEAEELKAEIKKETNRVNVPRNWDFVMHVNKNSETIAPDFVYDDGTFTYLGFSSIKTIPSVFLYDDANNESILNTHLTKDGNFDVLVIHKTAKQILLRSGNKLVGIFNVGYGKNPLDKTFDTSKKNVERERL